MIVSPRVRAAPRPVFRYPDSAPHPTGKLSSGRPAIGEGCIARLAEPLPPGRANVLRNDYAAQSDYG